MEELELVTVKEFSRVTGFAEITIRQWMAEGKIKNVKIGFSRRIYKTEIERMIKKGVQR